MEKQNIKPEESAARGQSGAFCSVAARRVERIGNCTLYLGNCFEIVPQLDIDFGLWLTDPPYGVTENKWDVTLDLDSFWNMILPKMAGACVLTTTEPFTAEVIVSNRKDFRYDLIWEKGNATGFLNAKKMPLRSHENVLVFYKKLPKYTPQKFKLTTLSFKRQGSVKRSTNYGKYSDMETGTKDGSRFPRSVFSVKTEAEFYNSHKKKKIPMHPTQKPVALMEYLAGTYLANGIVCDPFMGSGTTGVACVNNGLEFVGVEQEEKYFEMACERIRKAIQYKPRLFDTLPEQKPKPTQMNIL